MSDKQNDRLEKLWQAAGKKLSDDDVEILKEEKDLLLEHKLLSSSAIEPYTKEQLKDLTFSAGCAALLKKVFPCKLSGWSCVLSYSPCIAPTMSVKYQLSRPFGAVESACGLPLIMPCPPCLFACLSPCTGSEAAGVASGPQQSGAGKCMMRHAF
jgi:hypothetical protein